VSEAMLNKKVNNDVWNKANNEVNNKFDVLATMFLRYV
jgi:ribosomal protein L31E